MHDMTSQTAEHTLTFMRRLSGVYFLGEGLWLITCFDRFLWKPVSLQSFHMQRRPRPPPSSQETLLYDRVTRLETTIIDRIAQLKKVKIKCECRHFQHLPPSCEPYDSHSDYYDKFWKRFLVNQLSQTRLRDSNRELDRLEASIEEVEQMFEAHQEMTGGRSQKRVRRPSNAIEKEYQCPYPRCSKQYSAEVALNLHIKLKHNGGSKTERQRAAELICEAREHGRPIPNFYINLPPGFVEEYGRRRRVLLGSGREDSSGNEIEERSPEESYERRPESQEQIFEDE